GQPLLLGRSGKYASYTCLTNHNGKGGCSFKGFKSVKIVEESILNYLSQTILTEERIEDLVNRANMFLIEESAKPKPDLAPLRSEYNKLRGKTIRLVKVIEDSDEDAMPTLVRQLKENEKRLKELSQQLRSAESQHDSPKLLDLEIV